MATPCGSIKVDGLVVGRVVESAIIVEDKDFTATSDDPFVVVIINEQRADVNATL